LVSDMPGLVEEIIHSVITEWPLALILLVVIMLYIDKRFKDFEERIKGFIRSEISLLRHEIASFNRTLLEVLHVKNILTDAEVVALKGFLNTLRPRVATKYYTKEVYDRLGQLLKKDLDEYTWDDIKELQHIAKLIELEGKESGRDDLLDYASRLRIFIMLLEIRLKRKGIPPKPLEIS